MSVPSPNSFNSDKTLPLAAQPEATNSIFSATSADKALNRGRLAAFPAITLASFTRAQLGVTAATGGGLGRYLGLSGEREERISVAVAQVEEVHLPGPLMVDLIGKFLGTSEARQMLDPSRVGHIERVMRDQQGKQSCPEKTPPQMSIIFLNRVFYARSIEYDFGERTALAGELSAVFQRQSNVSRRGNLPGSPTTTGNTASALEIETNELMGPLSALAGAGLPGVGGTLAIGSSGSLVLKQVFDRPLAFGVDGSLEWRIREIWQRMLDLDQATPQVRRRTQSQPRADFPVRDSLTHFVQFQQTQPNVQPTQSNVSSDDCAGISDWRERLRCASNKESARPNIPPNSPLHENEKMILQRNTRELGGVALSPR